MDDKRQVQKELFEEFAGDQKRKVPKGMFYQKPKRTFTIHYEHLILIIIAVIILSVIFFSLGVESGKRTVKSSVNNASIASKQQEALIEPAPKNEVPEPAVSEAAQLTKAQDTQKAEDKIIYTIQIASYNKEEAAKVEAGRIEAGGSRAFVILSGKYYIVCVGEFAAKKDADPIRKKLRKKYPDCFIKKR